MAFEACEKLYFVLQLLSFPFPNGFGDKLLHLGYACLPRDMFLQYVDAEIITLSEVRGRLGPKTVLEVAYCI